MKQLFTLVITLFVFSSSVFAYDGHGKKKAVLVTGASSGIGLNITEHLVKSGYYVYAGARKEADLKRLDAMENVSSVKLDVTKDDEIAAAVKLVEAEGRGLYGVINNAGVGTFTRISEMSVGDINWIYDINVLGPHRVNQAFMPMLKDSKGRTATIGSISGYLSNPASGAYSMSKMAAEVYIEALDEDVQEYGMQAALIAPGAYKSKIREKVAMHMISGNYEMSADEEAMSDEQRKQLTDMRKRNDELKDPDEVSEAVLKFLSAEDPKTRYMVTPNENQARLTVQMAMTRMLDTNADQPYEFSREQLIKMMDEMLNPPAEKAEE